MVTRLSRILALAIGLGLGCQASAWSEIFFLRDGRLAFGTIVGTSDGKIACTIGGQSQSLDIDSIIRSETDISAIADTRVEVRLLDASVIEGTITGYDENEGLSLETSFGQQKLSPTLISSIADPRRRSAYSGPKFLIGTGAGAYAPVLSGASGFGPSWTAAGGAAWALGFAHGLFAGIDLAYSGADYLAGGLGYSFVSLRPELSYRFDLPRAKGLLARLKPLVGLSAGPAYIGLSGAPTSPSSYGNPTAEFGLSAGLEASMGSGLFARLEGRGDAYLQKDAPFITLGGLLSISYGR
jgi:small nuclear ribonucleoprotein (snRNP)-like protein